MSENAASFVYCVFAIQGAAFLLWATYRLLDYRDGAARRHRRVDEAITQLTAQLGRLEAEIRSLKYRRDRADA